MTRLSQQDKFLIRRYTIISMIRVLSEYDFSDSAIATMTVIARTVHELYNNHGSISDEDIYELYCEKMEEVMVEELHEG